MLVKVEMPPSEKKPIGWFKQDPKQPRRTFDAEDLRKLGMSMMVRQLSPLICLQDGTIVCGERRYRAAKLVGLLQLDVICLPEGLSETEVRCLQLVENLQRQDLTAVEQHLACIELKRLNPSWTNRDLAAHLHKEASMITRLLSPQDCIEAVRAAFLAGKVGISQVYVISKLPAEQQAETLAMYEAGMTRDQLAAHCRRRRNGHSEDTTRMKSVKIQAGKDTVVRVSGANLCMSDIVETLAETLKEARKSNDAGWDVKTWAAVMRDRAKA